MFRLFRRRRDKPTLMYSVFQKMGNAIDKRQRAVTDYLNAKAEGLTIKQLRIGLVFFCLVFGSSIAVVVMNAFHGKTAIVSVTPIQVPAHVITEKKNMNTVVLLTPGEIKNIRLFQNYLDSLHRTAHGKATYDSLLKHRPGLLDSLAFIKSIYNEQLK